MVTTSSPPPLAPPTTEETRVLWLRLLRSRRVGPMTFFRLLAEHGTVENALSALPDIAKAAGVKAYVPCPPERAQAELTRGLNAGAVPIFAGEAHYPNTLWDIPDRPPMIWAKGDVSLLNKPGLALVGARNASSLGRRMAKSLAGDLAQAGFVIISGLARGIDAQAHSAALKTGTIAVVAGGVDVIYPKENQQLHHDIAAEGVIVAEHPPGMQPLARHFPSRNRIVSALSQAVVVVEAAVKSGSLITARNALDQGRDVFAVPGHPFDARASGCNLLIRDGATLVRNVSDVIEALGPLAQKSQPAASGPPVTVAENGVRHALSDRFPNQRILDLLGANAVAEDQLARDLALSSDQLAVALIALEMSGDVTRQPGGLVARSG